MASSRRSCPSCGRPVTDTARICIGCGHALPTMAPGIPAPGPISDPVTAAAPAAPAAAPLQGTPAPAPLAAPPPPSSPLGQALPPPSSPLGQASPAPAVIPWTPDSPIPPPPGWEPSLDPGPPAAVTAATAVPVEAPPVAHPPQLPPPPPPFPRPDLSPSRALRRVAARNSLSAGVVAGLVAAALVLGLTALVALLFWGAHLVDPCNAQATLGNSCSATGANGYLTNWNAVLWQMQGGGELLGTSSGISAPIRIPLGLGILLVGASLYLVGRLTVRFLFLRSPVDALARSLVIASSFTGALAAVGAVITARSEGFALGPDYPMVVLWGLGLGVVCGYAGILRSTFPHAPRRAAADVVVRRAGAIGPLLRAAVAGLLLALGLSMVAGLIAMVFLHEDTTHISQAAVGFTTTKLFPDGALGNVAVVVLLVLAAPTIAAWVLAYSLILPTITFGGLDWGLTTQNHDAWLWVTVLVPIAATLFTGFAAARLQRAGSVESAVVSGVGAGLIWALAGWLVIVLLDGDHGGGGGYLGGTGAGLGPAVGMTLGALVLWGVVGGALGAYLSLVTVNRRSRLPLLRRYSAERVGPPVHTVTRTCPVCALGVVPEAATCPRCGSPMVYPVPEYHATGAPPPWAVAGAVPVVPPPLDPSAPPWAAQPPGAVPVVPPPMDPSAPLWAAPPHTEPVPPPGPQPPD